MPVVSLHAKANLRSALLFTLLTFAITWGWWGVRLWTQWQALFTSGRTLERAAIGPLDIQMGMFGPLLAALIMRVWISREGLAGSLGWKRSWKVYRTAYLLPTGIGLLAIAANHFLGIARFAGVGQGGLSLIPGQLLITLLAALTAVGEEYGWRGYLLPKLLPFGAARAALLTGLVWGFWHLPLVLGGLTYPGQPVSLAVPVFLFSLILLSFLFTWFYHFSQGSVTIAALVHGSLNALTELTGPRFLSSDSPLFTNPFGLTTALAALLVVIMLQKEKPKKDLNSAPGSLPGKAGD